MDFIRKCIPTSHEIECKDKVNRPELDMDIGVKEFSFIKMFKDDELESHSFDKEKLKQDFRNFCKSHPGHYGIFYPQFTSGKKLSDSELKIIDYIQDIPETDIRLLHFKGDSSFEEFEKRAEDFVAKNSRKNIIPVLNVNIRSKVGLVLLGQKAEYISDNFDDCIVNYSHWKTYDLAWEVVSSTFDKTNWSVFKVPTAESGGFSLILLCFLMGANGTCHRLHRPGGKGKPNPPVFLNSDLSLTTLQKADSGIRMYSDKDRIQFIAEDGRSSYLRAFSKWDRIVQANAFCNLNKKVSDLKNLKSIEHAYNYFSQ